jgi:hypothetical protein
VLRGGARLQVRAPYRGGAAVTLAVSPFGAWILPPGRASPQNEKTAYHHALARRSPIARLSSLESKKNNRVGAWRSLVAHLHGVQGVPSSNLGAPTNHKFHNKISRLQADDQQQHRSSPLPLLTGGLQGKAGAPTASFPTPSIASSWPAVQFEPCRGHSGAHVELFAIRPHLGFHLKCEDEQDPVGSAVAQ